MDRATSYNYYKPEIKEWIINKFSPDSKILDVGAGRGTYYSLLRHNFNNIEAVEVYSPNIDYYKLRNKYLKVYNTNIIDFKYAFYDLIIFGDIIEHLSFKDAQRVLAYAYPRCTDMIIAIPYKFPQHANENPFEEHIQDDLTHELVLERYPYLIDIYRNYKYGYYTKNLEQDDMNRTFLMSHEPKQFIKI